MPYPLAEHGTAAGYRTHKKGRRGWPQEACWACQVAWAQFRLDYEHAARRRQVLLEALAGFDRYHTGRRERAA
jgi:hypothetical protein